MAKRIEPIPFMGLVEVDDDVVESSQFNYTLQEVADKLGISRGTVSVTERRALRKFKQKFLEKFKKEDLI